MSNKSKKILIVGRTGAGKDYIADLLSIRYGLIKLKSYATRPKRSQDDNSHIFISADEVENYRNDMIAYTEIGEYKYFATKKQLDESDIYIIDPSGIAYLLNHCNEYNFLIVYISANKELRIRKSIERSDNANEEVVSQKRNIAEGMQFNDFEEIIKDGFISYNNIKYPVEIIYNEYNADISKAIDSLYSKYISPEK